jgi:acyl carrier protein
MGIETAQLVNLHQPLQELGLDSLMAVELRNNLGKAVSQTLPATLLFEHPTLDSLVNYLAGEVLKVEPETAPPPKLVEREAKTDTLNEQVPADLETLSEDEMAALLLQKLAEIQ